VGVLVHIDQCSVRSLDIIRSVGKKKINKKVLAKATLAEVSKEMAKPRVAASVREYLSVDRNCTDVRVAVLPTDPSAQR